MFGRRRDVSRILLRDDLLPAKAACDPHRTSARPRYSRPGQPHIVDDPGSPGAVPGELSVEARITVCAL